MPGLLRSPAPGEPADAPPLPELPLEPPAPEPPDGAGAGVALSEPQALSA